MKAIRFGLAAIKGCGEGAASALVESRTNDGSFTSLYDTCSRAGSAFNKGVLHSLAGAGALDCWGVERAALASMHDAVQERIKADKKAEKRAGNTPALFDLSYSAMPLAIPDVAPWSTDERLRQEKEAIGFYQSGHPLKKYSAVLDKR
jgi:DNA polymerase-3 subunit alpha